MPDNKLIAEFMGVEIPRSIKLQNETIKIDNTKYVQNILQYHTSWDWLMPVVKRCWEIANELEIGFDEMTLEHRFDCIAYGDLDESYEAVVEFIKRYNDHFGDNNN